MSMGFFLKKVIFLVHIYEEIKMWDQEPDASMACG